VAAIRAAIRARGLIPFATFMALALYHPRAGYYSALRAPPGPRGDFYTSPETHPAFGGLLARQLCAVWERLGRPRAFVVEEWGAGSGRLADDILTGAPVLAADFASSLQYTIVERSPALCRAQQRLLRPWGDRLRWATAPAEPETTVAEPAPAGAAGAAPLVGCVLANELLDAFAVHRLVRRGDALHELYVELAADGFAEREGPICTPALEAYFRRLGLLPPEGATVEVNLGVLDWLRDVAARLERGVVLVVDYAHPAEVLYSSRYPRGTLCAYYRHSVSENPYVRIGQQDLTAHVDLTSLLLEGRAAGLEPLGVARQRHFLERLGLADYEREARAAGMSRARGRASLDGLAALARPGGLGDYWVVGFGRGLRGPLHGLDETARPLGGPVPRPLLEPRLAWDERPSAGRRALRTK